MCWKLHVELKPESKMMQRQAPEYQKKEYKKCDKSFVMTLISTGLAMSVTTVYRIQRKSLHLFHTGPKICTLCGSMTEMIDKIFFITFKNILKAILNSLSSTDSVRNICFVSITT